MATSISSATAGAKTSSCRGALAFSTSNIPMLRKTVRVDPFVFVVSRPWAASAFSAAANSASERLVRETSKALAGQHWA